MLNARRTLWLGAVLMALHLSLSAYFEPPANLFGGTPLFGCDFDTHVQQAMRVLEGMLGWGKTWVYDVHLLAGHPNGVIFDADNKGWELVTYLLVRLGLKSAVAFNMFIVLAHALVVPVYYASARLFDLTRGQALLAAALGSMLWFFDGHLHWMWWVGTVAYVFSAYLWLLPLGLFYRFCQRRQPLVGLSCALCTALIHTIHPYSFFALALPMTVLYVGLCRSGTATLRDQLVVLCIVATTLLWNALWIVPSLQQWHYFLDSGIIGQATPWQLVADYLGLVLDSSTSGLAPNRTTLRFFTLLAAAAMLLRYRRSGDPRYRPLAYALVSLLGIAYVGSFFKLLSQIQPYRLIDPATCLAVIPAAPLLLGAGEQLLAQRKRLWTAPALLLALLATKPLTHEVLGFFEDALPPMPPAWNGEPVSIIATGYKPAAVYKHILDSPDFWVLPRWLDAQVAHHGRVLVDNGVLGEQLAWKSQAEVLGGFVVRNVEHSYANLFRRHLEGQPMTESSVRAYLEAYAVEFVVLMAPEPWLEQLSGLFEPYAMFGGVRVLRTRVPVSRFERGSGEVSAVTNRISVSGTDPTRELVLRYHFHEMLGCTPDCQIEPHANPVGGVPFIRVPAPHPAAFTIYNTYRTQRTRR